MCWQMSLRGKHGTNAQYETWEGPSPPFPVSRVWEMMEQSPLVVAHVTRGKGPMLWATRRREEEGSSQSTEGRDSTSSKVKLGNAFLHLLTHGESASPPVPGLI